MSTTTKTAKGGQSEGDIGLPSYGKMVGSSYMVYADNEESIVSCSSLIFCFFAMLLFGLLLYVDVSCVFFLLVRTWCSVCISCWASFISNFVFPCTWWNPQEEKRAKHVKYRYVDVR